MASLFNHVLVGGFCIDVPEFLMTSKSPCSVCLFPKFQQFVLDTAYLYKRIIKVQNNPTRYPEIEYVFHPGTFRPYTFSWEDEKKLGGKVV